MEWIDPCRLGYSSRICKRCRICKICRVGRIGRKGRIYRFVKAVNACVRCAFVFPIVLFWTYDGNELNYERFTFLNNARRVFLSQSFVFHPATIPLKTRWQLLPAQNILQSDAIFTNFNQNGLRKRQNCVPPPKGFWPPQCPNIKEKGEKSKRTNQH